jgi:tetratricopeptide (TPR) repeat protein
MYFYSINDYDNFKIFSDELSKIDIENNPYYKEQKQIFKYILNIFAFYFINFAQKAKNKEKFIEISTSFFNQAERMTMFDPLTMICKGFIYFAQGNYSQAETYFSNISETDINNNSNKIILILSEIGKGLNFFNKGNFEKASEHFIILIKQYDYLQENVLECLGICYYNMNQIKKSIGIFKKTLEINPKNYKVLIYLAMIELKDFNYSNDNFDKAFNFIKKAYLEKNTINNKALGLGEFCKNLNSTLNSNSFAFDCESEFDYLFIIFAEILLISGKIEAAEEIVNSLNRIIEFGSLKSSSREIINSNNEKYIKENDEIKSEIFCLNGNIYNFKVK